MTFLEQCCHGLVLELAELGIEAMIDSVYSDPYVSFEPYTPIVEFRVNSICFWKHEDDTCIEFEYADPNSIPRLIVAIRKVLDEIPRGSTDTDQLPLCPP